MELAPAIVELRQYLLKRGRRDELVELFEREFVESQEAVGIRVIGQFRDVDRVNHFVWLRGFADMDSRRAALTAFYGGPVWKSNSAAANATMIDSDDVLLLRPASAQTDWPQHPVRFISTSPPAGASDILSRTIANELQQQLGKQALYGGKAALKALA